MTHCRHTITRRRPARVGWKRTEVVPCDCDDAAAGGARAGQRQVRGTRARGTRQAQALAAALDRLPGFCSAQEIHAELRRKGEHVGLTTVYRHLQALSEQGRVDAIRDASGEIALPPVRNQRAPSPPDLPQLRAQRGGGGPGGGAVGGTGRRGGGLHRRWATRSSCSACAPSALVKAQPPARRRQSQASRSPPPARPCGPRRTCARTPGRTARWIALHHLRRRSAGGPCPGGSCGQLRGRTSAACRS